MNEQEKKDYDKKYKEAKEKGVPFFPDIIFKDSIAVLILFIILVALAYFIGAPVEARANPNDTTYTPRPEWYFLFLFQLLKYFPGNLEVIGGPLPSLPSKLARFPSLEGAPMLVYVRPSHEALLRARVPVSTGPTWVPFDPPFS